MRHQQNGAKPPNSAQTGWFPWNAQQVIALEPPRLLGLFWNLMASQAPLLTQEGSFKRATVNWFTPSMSARYSCSIRVFPHPVRRGIVALITASNQKP